MVSVSPDIVREGPPELDQPRLLDIQFQVELRKSSAKVFLEPLGVVTMLEPQHEDESPGGVSPPGARRTRREPLSSPGSHRPAVRAHAEAPVREQAGLASGDVSDEPARPVWSAAQPFVFPHGPPHERVVEVAEDRIQHGLVEASVIVDPALELDD